MGNCLLIRNIDLSGWLQMRVRRSGTGKADPGSFFAWAIDDSDSTFHKNHMYQVLILYMSNQNSAGITDDFTISSTQDTCISKLQHLYVTSNGAYNALFKTAIFLATADRFSNCGFSWNWPSNNGISWNWCVYFYDYYPTN